jgi:hypothetical protein
MAQSARRSSGHGGRQGHYRQVEHEEAVDLTPRSVSEAGAKTSKMRNGAA